MWNVGANSLLSLGLTGAITAAGGFFFLARIGFRRAWGEFRALQEERVRRASGLLSPALAGLRPDPFQHLPETHFTAEGLRFVRVVSRRRIRGFQHPVPPHADPLLEAVLDWEHHHHSISQNFIEALGHVAHHRLIPKNDIHQKIDPIGEAIQRLIEQCPEPSLQKELGMAYSGLRKGAEQNLEYVARSLRETAEKRKTEFHVTLGAAHSELGRFRGNLITAICAEADKEIQLFLNLHRGFRLNPFEWGRQTAYYREFEQLRARLDQARASEDLSQVALIVLMIVEDEKGFVDHLHAASQLRDAIHRDLSAKLQESEAHLDREAHNLTGWVSLENQRLQSTVSHQLILHLEAWVSDKPKEEMQHVRGWIDELMRLRDQDLAPCSAAA